MKLIEQMSEQIEEEICDARKYIDCALKLKEDEQQLAKVYYDLANEELKHVDKLHEAVVELISEYKEKHGEPPERMRWVYEYLHKKHVEHVEEVKVLIGTF